MNIMRIFLVMTALFWSGLAEAQFETIVVPEGMDFECEPDWTVQECQEELESEIWYNTYYDKVQSWKEELFFNTNIYFHDYEETWLENGTMVSHEGMDFLDQGNLIDVRYDGFKRYSWAFAIEVQCEKGWNFYGENCAPIFRMVDFNNKEILLENRPKTKSEVVDYYGEKLRWRESNIRSCKDALNHLLKFPKTAKTQEFWHKGYVNFLKGLDLEMPDEIIVVADGDGVLIRARGQSDPTANDRSRLGQKFILHNDRNDGPGYQWALEMKEIVEPCLVPSEATPPWEKVLAHGAANKD